MGEEVVSGVVHLLTTGRVLTPLLGLPVQPFPLLPRALLQPPRLLTPGWLAPPPVLLLQPTGPLPRVLHALLLGLLGLLGPHPMPRAPFVAAVVLAVAGVGTVQLRVHPPPGERVPVLQFNEVLVFAGRVRFVLLTGVVRVHAGGPRPLARVDGLLLNEGPPPPALLLVLALVPGPLPQLPLRVLLLQLVGLDGQGRALAHVLVPPTVRFLLAPVAVPPPRLAAVGRLLVVTAGVGPRRPLWLLPAKAVS